MKSNRMLALLAHAALCLGAHGLAQAADQTAASAPIRVILVGDSTMAHRSGYGDALCERFTANVTCVNLALGGRSSKSFRGEGHWDKVEKLLKDGAKFRATYVLVQFGHNDQPGKEPRSTDIVTEFPANMARYASETKELGGVPVLVTPLTRRTFKHTEGGDYLKDDLGPWADATRTVAKRDHVALLELNKDSAAAVQAMGQVEADTLAMAPPPPGLAAAGGDLSKIERAGAAKTAFDRTHLGAKGADLFARMVERELVQALPETAAWFKDGGKQ